MTVEDEPEVLSVPADDRLVETVYFALASSWYRPEGPRDYERDTANRRGLAIEVVAALRGEYLPEGSDR